MRIFPPLVSCLFLGLGCVSQPKSPSLTLEEILALGQPHEEWPQDQTLVLEGSALLGGVQGFFKIELFGGNRYRLELHGATVRVGANDGTSSWIQTDEGPARRLVLLERDRMDLLIQAISGEWRRNYAHFVRSAHPSHSRAISLGIDFPGPAPGLLLEVDRDTGMVSAIASQNRGQTSRWHLEDWKEWGGRRLPGLIEFQGTRQVSSRLELQEAHWEKADPSRLRRPRGAEDARFDSAKSEAVYARRSATGHLFVPVRFDDGDEHWFLLDTGASGIVVDDKLARSISMNPIGVVGAVGGTGRALARLSRGHSLQVGPLVIDAPTILTLDLGGLAVRLGTDVEGILGCALFSRAAVSLPARASEAIVHIRPPGGFDEELGGFKDGIQWTPVLPNESVVTVRGTVESRWSGWFLLDTGAAWAAAIHTPSLEAMGLPGDRPATEGRTRGIVSNGRTLVVTLDELSFAHRTIRDVRTHLALVREGSLADRVLMGNIGIEALASFDLLIDLAHERLALQPAEASAHRQPGQR